MMTGQVGISTLHKLMTATAMALALTALVACQNTKGTATTAEGEPAATGNGQSVKLVDRDVEAPEVFQVTDEALWDGRPSLGGVWVASPDAVDPERVILRNPANGKFVIGALFKREAFNPGPSLQISSDAAAALGMLAGEPAKVSVTALRREEVAAETDASKPILDANEAVATTSLPATSPTATPAAQPAAGKPAAGKPAATPAKPGASTAAAPAAPAKPAKPEKPAAGAPAATATATAPAVAAPAKPAQNGPTVPVVSAQQGGRVQIGTFSVEENANKAVAALKKAGFEAKAVKGDKNGKTYWIVTASGMGNRDAMLTKIKGLGFKDAFFIRG